MGIRYFAHSVSPRQIAQASECPRGCYDGHDSWDYWGYSDAPTLDLDKCYPELQVLLGGTTPRPSYALVEGAVVLGGYGGWESFQRIIPVDEVKLIADDLDDLLSSPAEVALVACRYGDRDCVGENLPRAREFARRVADAGFGIHYSIG